MLELDVAFEVCGVAAKVVCGLLLGLMLLALVAFAGCWHFGLKGV